MVIKLISFIVLTYCFHFNELKIFRKPGYFFFFLKLNQQYFFYSVEVAGENIRFWGAVDPICPIQNLSLFCITAQWQSNVLNLTT